MVEKLFFLCGWGHDHTAQYKIFRWPSGPFKITLFGKILKLWVVKMLKISGLTAGFTYISIYMYTVYLYHFRVVSAAGEIFKAFFPLSGGRKIYLKSTRGGRKIYFFARVGKKFFSLTDTLGRGVMIILCNIKKSVY